MILIADSGSTKTQWVLINAPAPTEPFCTEGLNPLLCGEATILKACSEVMRHFGLSHSCQKLFFYGAGCGTKEAQQQMVSLLATSFIDTEIHVAGDLLGACRALYGTGKGLVGILGTGSNACYYDGNEVAKQLPSLGYLLGDEGSGNHIGRRLLKDFLTKRMPEALSQEFLQHYAVDYEQVIDALYRRPNANRFLASFAPFAAQHSTNTYIKNTVQHCFADYIEEQILPLSHLSHELRLVGSIAEVFGDTLAATARQHGITVSHIIKEPVLPLAKYHQSCEL